MGEPVQIKRGTCDWCGKRDMPLAPIKARGTVYEVGMCCRPKVHTENAHGRKDVRNDAA